MATLASNPTAAQLRLLMWIRGAPPRKSLQTTPTSSAASDPQLGCHWAGTLVDATLLDATPPTWVIKLMAGAGPFVILLWAGLLSMMDVPIQL